MTLTQQSSTRTRGITDPRNITDKRFITTSIGLLIEYLSQHGYDHFINPKILSSPSGKDFNNIVQFLFRQIDPNLTCPGKFEDEVIALFKFLRYPFNISKNGLSAVGSPHSWPQLLASLIWILELLEYDEEMMNTAENEEQQHASLLSSSALQVGAPTGGSTSAMESEDDQQNRQKLFYNYLKQAYKSFLNGDDDTYTALEQQYIESYQLKNQYFLNEIEKLNQINEQLDLEIQQVKSRRLKLPQLLEKKKDYLDDKNKFEILIEQLMKHKEMGEMKKQSRQQELEKLIQQIELTENEINFLKETISHQELSPEDVKRMSEEREHLQMSLNHSMEQLSQLQKKVWDQEVMLRDKVQNLEESVRLFNSMSEDLDYAITNAGTTPEKANLKKKIRIDLDTRYLSLPLPLSISLPLSLSLLSAHPFSTLAFVLSPTEQRPEMI
jgi:kinetochore protein NDC80